MRRFVMILALALVAGPAMAADNGPCWAGTPWFMVNQTYDFDARLTPGSEEGVIMVLSSTGARFDATLSGDVWTMSYSGVPFTGTGHATMSDPLPFNADIELRNTTGAGTVVLRAADYNPLSVALNVNGELWADMSGGTFIQIGTASLNATFSFTPAMIDWRWPLSVGDSWNYEMTTTAAGSFTAVVLGNTITQPIDESSVLGMAAAVASAFTVNVAQTNGNGSMTHSYNPDCQWYSHKEMTNILIGDSLTLNRMSWDITECGGINPCPTPTPPSCEADGVELEIAAGPWMAGASVSVSAHVCNTNNSMLSGYPLFVLLEAGGLFFFGPSWSQSLDHYNTEWAPGDTVVTIIPTFDWPAGVGSGAANFYGALLDPSMTALYGVWEMEPVSWQ